MKEDISKYSPCDPGATWYATQPDIETAWANCHRGDWMLWYAEEIGVPRRLLILAASLCAATVRHLMVDQRSKDVVLAGIRYGRGKIILGSL